jgi:hypothetical protein
VDVEREDTIGYLAEGVRVPDFAPKIDHLWLFVRGSDGTLEPPSTRTEAGRGGA